MMEKAITQAAESLRLQHIAASTHGNRRSKLLRQSRKLQRLALRNWSRGY